MSAYPYDETFVYTSVDDPRAQPLFDGLEQEYDSRYADVRRRIGGSAREELQRYPAQAFAAPVGAFMPHRDADTAEFKRIWTLPGLRRQGIARRVLRELEAQAVRQGYRRVFLTTGFRQPEAVGLYLSHGYTALFDLQADPETAAHLPFEKQLLPALAPSPAAPHLYGATA
ncbi:MAG: hypothetical protein GAK31_00683 [Stenotrophomonas maltophilia]|uniref:N-acetyltransferase domain-containing protein n=1 Tax=Stenotrophomonas maltophilia TaxID=40324 RepID=A0A7V8FJS1_STEMA|nr:MAG: hypothetical protein GAK31_00683 [Stenotrophomonas maltophilia]